MKKEKKRKKQGHSIEMIIVNTMECLLRLLKQHNGLRVIYAIMFGPTF